MRIHFNSDQNLGKKRFDAFSEQKVHYKMFKAGKNWLYAGIFMLSLGAGMLGIGGTVGHAETTQDNATSTTDEVKPTADTGSYTLQATSNNDQSAASDDTSANSVNTTNNTETTSDTSASATSSKNAAVTSSATDAAKAAAAVAPDTATQTTAVTSTKEAANTTNDKASTNSTSNTAAAQQSSAVISSSDKTTASDMTDATTKADNATNEITNPTQDTKTASTDAASPKATATSVTPVNQKLDTGALTDATANTYASLQEMKTATAGMTQEELISYVSAHNNAAKAANGGTIFVVSNSGDIIQMTAKADLTYTANYTFKDEDGNDVAAPETKTSTLANAAQAIVEPPYVPGYQLDMDASQLHVVQANKTGMSDTASITDYMKNLNTIISAAGGLIDNVQLNSFQDLLNVFAAMNGVDQKASGVVGSLFQDILSPATSQTGNFNYVYKKSDSTIQTQTQTVNVGDPVPAMSSFVTTAKDASGKDISAALTSPDYANLSTQTTGDKTFTVEYFNMTNLEFIQAQATLKVAEKATKDVVSVDNKTITYGADVNGKGSDIGLTISDSDTDLTMPTLTATDYTIMGAKYSASGHLAAGTYTIKLSNDGFKKVSLANPDMLVDPLVNFKNGTLTVNKATATFTATSATKEFGAQDPTLGYTVTGAANGDTLGATVTREAGETAGDYKETVTPTNLDTANYTAKVNDGTFKITPIATNSTVNILDTRTSYGNDDNYGIYVKASDPDVKIPTLSSSDFTVENGSYSQAGHLNVGEYTVKLNAAGISKIAAANPGVSLSSDAYGTGKLTIGKAKVLISAQNISKVVGAPDPAWNIAISGQASNEKVAYTVSRAPGDTAGTYTITPSFDPNTEINKNYDISTLNGKLTIIANATDIYITPNSASVGYGDIKVTPQVPGTTAGPMNTNHNFGFTYTGTLPTTGTMPTLTADDFQIMNGQLSSTGNLAINDGSQLAYMVFFTPTAIAKITAAFPAGTFKNDTFSTGFLTVTKKTIQITPNSVTKEYGQPDPAMFDYTTSAPIPEGENVIVTVTRAPGDDVGSYDLTASATDNPNYNFVYNTGTLTITKAPSTDTLTVGNAQMTYGDTLSQFTTQHVGGQLTIPDIPQSDYTVINGQYTNGRLNAGTYDVELNAAAQQLIDDANKDSNYELPTIKSGKLTVLPKAVTLTADNLSKAMGSTDPALTATDNGQLLSGDSLNYTVTRASGETMGTYTETIKLGTNPNYKVNTVPGTFTITGKLTAGSINLTDGTTTYGDLNQDATKDSYTFKSYLAHNTDKLVLPDGLTNADYVIQNATYSPSGYLNQGTYTVGLSDSGIAKVKAANKDFDLQDANFIAGTIVVTPATLTVTPQSVSKDAGQADPTWTTTVSGALAGDTPTVTGYTVTRSNTSETPGKYVISADVSQATVNDSNYVLAGGDAILTINPKTTTDKIVVTPTGITYGDDTTGYVIGTDGAAAATNGFKVTATVQGGNDLVVPDFDASDFTIANAQLSASGHLNAGSYAVSLTAAGLAKIKAANPDYVINADGSNLTLNQFTVAKKTATITADNQSKVYGTADPQLTYKTAGVVDGDDIGAVTVTRKAGDNVGTYAITPAVGDNANYDFKYVNGALTITALALTGSATVTAQPVTYGSITKDGDIIKGRDSNIEGDNAFGITLEGHTLDSSTLTPADYTIGATDTDHNGNYLDAGSYTVTLNDAGKAALAAANPNYDFSKVTFTDGSLTVAQAKLYLNIYDHSKVYGQPDPNFYPTVAGFVLDDEDHNSVHITVNREPGEDVGTYTITPVLATPSRNYKVVSTGHATLTITPATISASDVDMQVKPNDQTITYGQTPADFVANFGSKLNPVDLTNADFEFTKQGGTASSSIPTDVGSYTVSLTADAQTAIANANPNYTFTSDAFKTGLFTINPIVTTPGDKDTEITANNAAIIHGQATPDFSASYGAKVKDAVLTQDDFTVNNTVASSTDVPTAVGNYTLTLNESGINKIKAANPTFAFSAGDFIAGTYKIVEVTTSGTLTVNTTYTGAPKPASYPEQQTVDLTRTATVDNDGQVTYGDWTAQNVSDGNLVTALTVADVPVSGYTVAVSGDTGAYTLADFTNATSGADATANVVLNRTVTYTTKTFSTGTPGQDGDSEGTQAQYLAGTITVTQTNTGDYTKPVANQTVNVSRTATLDSNGNVVYSDWTTDGTNKVLVPELTNDGAAVKGYTDTVTDGSAYTSDNFKTVSDAGKPGDKGYAATVSRTVNYKLNQNEYTQGSAGDPAKNDPEGTQAKYLTGTITVSQTNTGDYTAAVGNTTVNVSRTATLDKNGNVVYSDWTTDGTNKTLVNALTSADVKVPGFTATIENGAAYTSDNFKAVTDAGEPGDKGYTANVARTVNYKLNQTDYTKGNPGDPTNNDPEGTQAKYLEGTITVSQTNTGDYTKPVGNTTVNVSRTATLDKDGRVVYSDWTTDGTNKVLVSELTDSETAVKGYTNTVTDGAAYTSDNFKAVSDAGEPGDKGYTATVSRTVNYKLNQADYTKGNPGDPTKNDPEGTQAKYLTGTITVSQTNTGDYTKPVGNQTVNVSRTATLDKNGNVVYSDWATDGTNKVLVPELTTAETAVKGYTNTVTDGGEYTSDNFKAVTDAGTPSDEGYTTTVSRTVNYKLNQTEYTQGNPGDPTKNDPEGTQAKYLEGTITVSQTNTGDYTKPVGNTTVNVSRTATLDKNGNVVYSDWTADGTNKVLVSELTDAGAAVKGYTDTVINGASYTSDNFKAVTDAGTPGDKGYTATVARTVNYKLNQSEYTQGNPGDPTKNDPEGTQAKYLTGTITVSQTNTGDYTKVVGNQTVNVSRTATLDKNGNVVYSDWTTDGTNKTLVNALTSADVNVAGFTATVENGAAYTSDNFKAVTDAVEPGDKGYTTTVARTVNYKLNQPEYTKDNFGDPTKNDPEGTQAKYLTGTITVSQINTGDYTKPVGNITVNVSRTATLDKNGNVIYSDWTTDGTDKVLVPELTAAGAAVKGYTDTVTNGASYTSDNFKAVTDADQPGDNGYVATVSRTVNYKLNQPEYTKENSGDPTKNDPEGTQAKYLTGIITVSQTNTGDYTKPVGNTTVNVSRTATLDKNGNVVYSDWTTDGTNEVLVPELTDAETAIKGYTNTVTDGAAYTSDNFKAVTDAGTPGDKGYTTTVSRTVNYKLNQPEYTKENSGDPTKNDPEGTQAKYLTGTITVSQTNTGDYTKPVGNTTVNVSRTATLDKNGNVVYSDWTTDGTNKVLVPELTADDAAVKGYTDTVTDGGAAYTSDEFKAVSDASEPGDKGYVATVSRTVNYKLTQLEYTKENSGDPTKNDPEGTQAKYLKGTITVSQTNTGDYTKPVGNTTVNVSRTATLDKNGNVVYSAWTTDGTNEVLVPELTSAETAVKGYTNTVTDGGSYTSADFKAVTDAGKPSDNGYTAKVSRTVNYKLNQPEYTKGNAGDPTKNDPEGTQAKYLEGTITVSQINTGDYTKAVGDTTVNISRTATLDKDGNVVYGDWTIDGTNKVLVPELTADGAAVKGYSDTVKNGEAYTSDSFKAVTDDGTPGDKGYTAKVSRTVNYTKHTYTTGTPGGTDDPAGTQAAYLTGTITINRTNTGDYTATVAPTVVNVTREASLDANGNVIYSAWTTDGTADWTTNGANVILVPALTDAAAAVKGYTDSVTQGKAYTSGMFNAEIGSSEPGKEGYTGTVTQVVNYAYNQTTTNDVDGGETIIKTDGSGKVVQIEKHWPDGDKTVVIIDDTGDATFTETPNSQPNLPTQTVKPGETATAGRTTLTNIEPKGIELTHKPTNAPSTTETVAPDGSKTITMTGEPVSVDPDDYYDNTNTSVDGGGAVDNPTTTPDNVPNTTPETAPTVTPAGNGQTTPTTDNGTGVQSNAGGLNTGANSGTGIKSTNSSSANTGSAIGGAGKNTGTAQGQAVDNSRAAATGTSSHVSGQTQTANKQGQLPQTNDKQNSAGATIGLGLLGLLAAFGFKRKKRDDE
ncbi:MBG domain-containing protein [Secundilactobacillus yichangensis]|uniref:MBG domain-containing protein n=1 Tax=Secundilactobacillus yichangensis TaxID=2799580 RepID=UPI00194379F8|nr:MBG domain-containing protein [Secundilactobacillus yichangensis]